MPMQNFMKGTAQMASHHRPRFLNNLAQRAVYAAAAPFLLVACTGGTASVSGPPTPSVHAEAGASSTYVVNDAYTMSSRFDGNRAAHPESSIPELSMQQGQRILFDRRYKSIGSRELHMDIFLPEGGNGNGWGIMLLHGGGWASGNKSNFYTIANGLAQRGYAVFLPEFGCRRRHATPPRCRIAMMPCNG